MQKIIELNFTDVVDYRKAVGLYLLDELCKNFSDSNLKWLEVGPGSNSQLVHKLILNNSRGENCFFIEPDFDSSEKIKSQLPSAKIYNELLENNLLTISGESFDFIFANFSLHWSDSILKMLRGLNFILTKTGNFGFTVTDSSRSFWAKINREFRKRFPECDLFKASDAKAFTTEDWKKNINLAGFAVEKELIFTGSSSIAKSANSALDSFKSACGNNYLKLSGSITKSEAETWILNELGKYINNDGEIPISASAVSFICKK